MRYSGFQFPEGVAVLDRDSGELVYYPIDGGETRVIRPADRGAPVPQGRSPSHPGDDDEGVGVPTDYPPRHDDERPRATGDVDVPSRQADTDPGLGRSVLRSRSSGHGLSAAEPDDDSDEAGARGPPFEVGDGEDNGPTKLDRASSRDELDRVVLGTFPYPVAAAYQSFVNETDPRRACRRLVASARSLVQLLAIVAARDALESPEALGDDYRRLLRCGLQRPSFATWHALLRQSLNIVRTADREPFCPELVAAYDELERRCEEPFVLERRPDAPRRLGYVQALVSYRDSLSEGFSFARERAHADLLTYRPVLVRLLEGCRFLTGYSLIAQTEESPRAGRRLRGALPGEPALELPPSRTAGTILLRHEASGRTLDLADFVVLADEVAPRQALAGLAGDIAVLERRRADRVELRSVSGPTVDRSLASTRWAALAGLGSAGPRRALARLDRGVLGAAAKRVTDAALRELAGSGQLLDDVVLPRPELFEALRRFELSRFGGFVLVGQPGSGRTTTLAGYARSRQEAGDLVLFYRGAALTEVDLAARLCADLGVANTKWDALLAGVDPHFQIPSSDASLDTIGPHFLVVLDGLEEAPVDLVALAGAAAELVRGAAEYPWFRMMTSISPAAHARLPEGVRPGQTGAARYFRVVCRRDGVRSECPWVTVSHLTAERLAILYEGYRLRRGSKGGDAEVGGALFRPKTAFGGLDREGATVGAMRHPLNLRLALRAFHERTLPSNLTTDAIEQAWYERVVLDGEAADDRGCARATTLEVLARELADRGVFFVRRHELEDSELLGPAVRNPEVDSSYSQLVRLGVLAEVWVDDICLVGLCHPSILGRLMADQLVDEVSGPAEYLALARRSVASPALAEALERLLLRALSNDGGAVWRELGRALGEETAGAVLGQSLAGALSTLARDRAPGFEAGLSALSETGSAALTRLFRQLSTDLWERGLTEAARRSGEVAVRSARSAGEGELLALARADLAAMLADLGEVDRALEELAIGLGEAEAEVAGDSRRAGLLALQQAKLLADRGDGQRARAAASAAASRLAAEPDLGASAEARLLEGRLAAEAGDTSLALTCLREGLALAEASGSVLLAAEALRDFRAPARTAAERAAMAEMVEPALNVLRVAGRFEWIPGVLAQLGVASAGSDPRGAESYLRRGLALAERLGRPGDEAVLLGHLGELLRREGRVREAERALTRSLELSAPGSIAAAKRRALLAGVQIDRGELAGLEASLRRAIREAQHEDDPELEGLTTLMLAECHLSKGRLAQAADYYRRSLDRFEAVGDRDSRGAALAGLGAVAHLRDDREAGVKHWKAVLRLGEELGDGSLTASALEGLALAASERGQADADQHLRALVRMAERSEQRLWQQRAAALQGRLTHRQGALDESAAAWRAALEQAERLGLAPAAARARLGLGRVHLDAGRLGPAHQEAQTAQTFFEANEHDLDLVEALAVQGLCSFAAGRLEAAEESFDRQRSLAAALGFDPGLARGLRLGAEVAFERGSLKDAATRWQRFAEMTDGRDDYRLDRDVLALRAALSDGRKEDVARAEETVRQTADAEGVHRPLGESAALALRACASFWAEQGEPERAEAARRASGMGR